MIDYYVKLCITEVSMNENKLLVGRFRDRHTFWIDGDDSWCTDSGDVKSHVIIIQNEAVAVSACGPLYCISISSTPNSACVTKNGNDRSAEYAGDIATVFHNNEQIGTLPHGFSNEEFCIAGVDVVSDQFRIVNGGTNGVSFSFMHSEIVQFV